MRASIVSSIALAAGIGFCAGCVSGKAATARTSKSEIVALADFQIQVAQADIRTARKAGAATTAPEKLRKAETTLKAAVKRMQKKQYGEVDRLTKQASSEAEDAKKAAGSKRNRLRA